MKFAQNVFWFAGLYGLVVIFPQLFLEERIGHDLPPAITHPEYFYGFIGVGLAWQVAFLILATDPLRYRPLIPACLIEKFSFALAVPILVYQGRTAYSVLLFGIIDLILGLLFLEAYRRLVRDEAASNSNKSTEGPLRESRRG